ncbi:transcription-repair coupling factor [Pelotomaculum isophthalicicum JI]|uniref:Transcription-repair-coupling factor n=1 Tax=Pelotomaculum isophthalicicum JI TaxID=947010 RepID=A0A9X4H7F1_9FIRM|nr:transcription-repair coupling factor [Pelotomaculum isophthalicicum]MDF9407714.1 transcription-repair coupling factor [Pelotomaculum isophthalicicum JI]
MRGILRPLQRSAEFDSLVQGIKRGLSKQLVYGLSGSQRSYLLAGLTDQITPLPVLVITPGERETSVLADELAGLLPGVSVRQFPVWELIPHNVLAQSKEITAQRLQVLEGLCSGERMVVVAPVEALLRRLIPPGAFRAPVLRLAVGERTSLEGLLSNLLILGYERVDLVEERGQFTLRGGILDVFPMTAHRPARLEFFDDEVDSIRRFNVQTQRSEEKTNELVIYPARELIIGDELVWQNARRALTREYKNQERKLSRTGDAGAVQQLNELAGKVLEAAGSYFNGIEHYLSFFYDETATLMDYLPAGALIFVDDPVRVAEVAQIVQRERAEANKELLAKGRMLPSQFMNNVDWSRIADALASREVVYGSLLPRLTRLMEPQNTVNFHGKALPSFLGNVEMLAGEIKEWRRAGYAIVLLVSGRQRSQQLLTSLKEYQIDAFYTGSLEGHVRPGNVVITAGSLVEGFELPICRLVVVTESNMYGQRKKIHKEKKQLERLTPFVDLKVGDYVVHVNYGIGRYLGVVPLTIADIRKEYLLVKYAGEDKLYVPVDQVGLIQKYLGSEGEAPRLSRLGGGEWARAKSRVREAVREMAQELLALYAARETVHGHGFGPDTVWQREFEESFPYEETPDQIRAIEEVKVDMERNRPMDRLLCGDVGYGKTEVALRAAFKAVMEGKQVAVLVPTTILAQQHYNTFRERFARYPVKVEVLSRFRTVREQRRVLQGLEQGTVDIVIGTHRLVQEDVRFKDLGLLVIDEEQRFGVAHKERLKFIRKNVDVLTLSATPIPRTLHMSLVGLRDTSLLETPPKDRYPIQTYVLDEDPVLFREAIRRELGRGGQVFFVYNRVLDMERVALMLQELVPEARIAMAHGQMKEDDLEQVMMDFLDGKYDVLVCTTIIENGLDISNVNTLLVKEADTMGLAQLYQLKGRVGRSNRLAYAYFTFRKEKVLGESAEKRLAAIREFTELGSGFKIAMRDLEIRGAGNILGAEQHGHIAAVGFDLYCRLLEEAVKEARGEKVTQAPETTIELPVEAYIPDTYIPETGQKVEIYKRIAALAATADLSDFEDELVDRFGDPPAVVQNLLAVAKVRILAGRLKVKKISLQPGQYRLLFGRDHPLTGEALVAAGRHYLNEVKFNNAGEEFEIKLKLAGGGFGDNQVLLKRLEDFLVVLGGCSNEFNDFTERSPEVATGTRSNV